MRTVKIQGGIGNQLFGLAFAQSAALISREPVGIDLAAYATDRYGHTFLLDDLARRLGDLRVVHRPFMAARFTTALMRAAPLPGYVSEGAPPPERSALAALIARGRYFNGYWQNEAFIADPEGFAARTREAVLRRAQTQPVYDVVVHYRTYREEIRPAARRSPGAAYVQAALERIGSTLGRPAEVALVSDDPGLAVHRLRGLSHEIAVAATGSPWGDMALLMNARAIILTNSSFSWWAGFCGTGELALYPRPDGYFHYPVPAARFVCV